MNNILIIGAGQLGSRHLQGLALVKEPLNIYLVDPNQTALNLCEQRFNEVDVYKNKDIYLCTEIKELPSEIIFMIISTNSLQRLHVLKQALKQSNIKFLVLEKFLFPFASEYIEAEELFENVDTKVYVNCAKRMWPNYVEFKKHIQNIKYEKINLTVSGVNWNLASNAVHYIDLLFYLTEEKLIQLDSSKISDNIYDNKRQGYVEFAGELSGITPNGHSLVLKCEKEKDGFSLFITLEIDGVKYEIDEELEKIVVNGEERYFKKYYQSQLTNLIYEQLIEYDFCNLPTFRESQVVHLNLLDTFNTILDGRKGIVT